MADNSSVENKSPENSASKNESNSPAPIVPDEIKLAAPKNPDENSLGAGKIPARVVSAQTPLRKKLERVAGATLEKFGFKKGRGRPKKCTACGGACCESCNYTGFEPSKSDKPVAAPVEIASEIVERDENDFSDDDFGREVDVAAVPHVPAVKTLPAYSSDGVPDFREETNKLFSRIVSNSASGAVDGSKKVLRELSIAAGNDEPFTEKILGQVSPSADSINDFSDSVKLAVKKRQPKISEKHGDLICLGASGAKLFAPMAFAAWQLIKEARKRNALLAKNPIQPEQK